MFDTQRSTRRSRLRAPALVLLVALALIAAACGDSNDSGGDEGGGSETTVGDGGSSQPGTFSIAIGWPMCSRPALNSSRKRTV